MNHHCPPSAMRMAAALTLSALILAGCGSVQSPAAGNTVAGLHSAGPNETSPSGPSALHSMPPAPATGGQMVWRGPVPEHVVIVIEENHSYAEIAGNPKAPYLNQLMRNGATLTNYHAVEHPSQPNYLDLFSGSNQGVTDDSCPHTFDAPNLASELRAAGLTFTGYAEDLPNAGFTGCNNGVVGLPIGATYARKHCPWINFSNVPADESQPFSAFPSDFSRLPTVAFVIPNLQHDMHDGTVDEADAWLKQHLDAYVRWAQRHNSLLIITWDEDDESADNRVPAIFVGPMVRPGQYAVAANHFSLLRTLEDMYHLPPLGRSRTVQPITAIWRS